MQHVATAEAGRDFKFEDVCDIVAPIAKKHGVDRVYMFGSRARGDNREDSDFDFYIVPGRIRTLTKLCGLMRDLEEALGRGVDIISEDPYLTKDFSQEVFRDRKLVYES